MREATGELNMTVVIVIAVAGLMAFFVMLWRTTIQPNLVTDTDCSDAVCDKNTLTNDGMVQCHKAKSNKDFWCPYKG